MSARFATALCLLSGVAIAQQQSDPQPGQTTQTGLTGCQICSRPGGDCSKAYKQQPGISCGDVNGLDYCCPASSKCWRCRDSYRCYSGIRPSSQVCYSSGGNVGSSSSYYGSRRSYGMGSEMVSMATGFLCFFFLLATALACFRQRRASPLMHTQQVVELQSVPVGGAVCGRPGVVPVAQPVVGKPCAASGQAGPSAGVPVAHAVACPQAGCTTQSVTHVHHHGGYGYGGGYGGGTVAMNAGMGFLGGMMVGEMLSDAGDHGYGGYGGGDYGGGSDFGGGGGDFAADM